MEQTTESSVLALTQQLATDNLALWSDDKRKLFVDTFADRIKVARFILIATANEVLEKALGRHFISNKHLRRADGLEKNHRDVYTAFFPEDIYDRTGGNTYHQIVGGRPIDELHTIASARAMEIIDQLPSLNDAVRVISPAVAKQIEERAKLLAKGKLLMEEAEALSGPVDMEELDQDMTLAAFRQAIKDREKSRIKLLNRLDEVGEEGGVLDSKINKFLYDGLPGLSDAVIKVIKDYLERATGFAGLNRRVSEQVQFGDSNAAMEMLKAFEKDEVSVSSDIKAQFDQAMEILRLSVKGKLGIGSKSASKRLGKG